MNDLRRKFIGRGLLLLVLFTLPSLGDSSKTKNYKVIEKNSTIEPFTLNDQFGKAHALEKIPKLLICSFGKVSGVLIANYFNRQTTDYVLVHDIKLMADVSSVPSLLRSMFIVPKMKKYNFEILIVTESKFAERFPKEENNLTVLKIENNIVKEITFVDDETKLKAIIEG